MVNFRIQCFNAFLLNPHIFHPETEGFLEERSAEYSCAYLSVGGFFDKFMISRIPPKEQILFQIVCELCLDLFVRFYDGS